MEKLRKRVFQIIQIGNTSDVPNRIFDIVIAVTILLNLFIIFFETFDVSAAYIPVLNNIELVTVLIFTVEYILRLWTADYAYPNEKNGWLAALRYMTSLFGIIDLLSFLPFYLPIFFPSGLVAFRILRVIRIFRLFRINAYYDAFNVITDVIKEKRNQILSSVFIIFMLLMASSLIMYNLEHEAQPDVFRNAFSGMWWAVSALLTVGYGDIYPITFVGKFVGIILAFLGVGLVAIPTGIISAGFVEQYTRLKSLAASSNEFPIHFVTLKMDEGHKWIGKKVAALEIPKGLILVAILRDKETVVPRGNTIIEEGDRPILAAQAFTEETDIRLKEVHIRENHLWCDSAIEDLPIDHDTIIVMIHRKHRTLIPSGKTIIRNGDNVIVFSQNSGFRA